MLVHDIEGTTNLPASDTSIKIWGCPISATEAVEVRH